mgnify:CR=1 FL=1
MEQIAEISTTRKTVSSRVIMIGTLPGRRPRLLKGIWSMGV